MASRAEDLRCVALVATQGDYSHKCVSVIASNQVLPYIQGGEVGQTSISSLSSIGGDENPIWWQERIESYEFHACEDTDGLRSYKPKSHAATRNIARSF